MQEYRNQAKKYRKEGNYRKAITLYEAIWDKQCENKIDCWLGWEYADSLKKLGMLDDAIDICKKVLTEDRKFKYNSDLLSWCLYEKYIKSIEFPIQHTDIQKTIRIADYMTNLIVQDEHTPYEKTVWKIIKIYKNTDRIKSNLLDYWLNKLNPLLLEEEPFRYTDKFGKDREAASRKEEWYALKSKTLINLGKYEECIKICEDAFCFIKEFHFDNDIWFNMRKANCLSYLGDNEKSLEILYKILIKKRHWVIYNNIFNIYFKMQKYNKALLMGYSAALSNGTAKTKVNLYFNIGTILEELNKDKYAYMHYVFSKRIRNENGWKVPKELDNHITELEKKINLKEEMISFHELKKYWIDEKIILSERYVGIITKILPNGKVGFINYNKQSIYFATSSVIGAKGEIKAQRKVSFSLIDSYDKRKDKQTKEAIDLIIHD